MLKLIGTDGSRFYSFSLESGKYSLGRNPESNFFIPDKTVSHIHAVIEIDTDKDFCYVTDLDSRNGTLLNGEKINSKTKLKVGDIILFGQVEFKLLSSDAISSATNKPQTAKLSDLEPEKSVLLTVNEALKPLPSKVTELPEVLPTLFEMAKILVLPEPKEIMLEHALKLVSKVIPADRLAVLTTMENNEVATSACLLPNDKDPGTFNLSKTIIEEILTEKSSILIDPQIDPRFAGQESIIMSEIKSAMVVPLFDEGRVLGLLYVDTTNPLHKYNDDYLHLMATFGNLIASRLLNYELMNERQEKQVIETELRRASLIQRNLLTKSVPRLPGYQIHAFQEQCRMVGGDLYDLTCLPDGRLLFIVADVSGKGMGGALLMSNILASFRILYNETDFSLSRAVKQVSLQLFKYSAPEDFATLFAGILNPADNNISFINAGHNPPLLLRQDGSVEYLEPSGTMIGAFDFSDWQEDSVELHNKDILLIFTDGVVEADKFGEQYSDERLKRFICLNKDMTPQKLIECVMKDVKIFVDNSPRSDDITMLAIRKD